ATRVLERRDRVQERRLVAATEFFRERIGIESLVVHRQRDDVGAETREDLQRPVVRRRLDEHAPASAVQELLREEDEGLQRAAREDDARGVDAVPLRDPLAQRAVAAARPVREDRDAVTLERSARAVRQL